MKSKQGVTLIMLMVIIIMMSTLLTVTVINGTDIYNDAKKTKFQSEISQIEILVQSYIKRNSGITFNEKVEIDISEYTADQKAQFSEENTEDNIITLYVVDLYEIDAEEVEYGTLNKGTTDRYLYSSVTNKVYYEQGIKIGDVIYHRVDE